MQAIPGSYIGPYRLLRQIGRGGSGQVFAATHERMDQEVALKIFSPSVDHDPQLAARFIQEARVLAQLDHPNIVRILHCDQLGNGTVYLAMEYLCGSNLREWHRLKPRPVPLAAVVSLGRQIADAMVEVHARSVVHRDLKPENVIVLPGETPLAPCRIKLVDFGIAKVPAPADRVFVDTRVETGAPIMLGTATYMAPEQCRNAADVTDRADVYALGVLLFELIADRPPFVAEAIIDVISMHMQAEPPSLRALAPAAPAPLSAFIASMLDKDPARRPAMLRVYEMLARPWESELETADDCLFPGLHPFTEEQAELFFGRRAEADELLTLLEQTCTGEPRWLLIDGPSGVGKSSLVQAGIVPALKERRSSDGAGWRIASMRPSDNPIRSLVQVLVDALGTPSSKLARGDIERSLRADVTALETFVALHTPPGRTLLLILEQLEELFTLGAADCRQLDALLSTALRSPRAPLRLLATLRSDFVHRLDLLPELSSLLHSASRYHLPPMTEQALTQVIRGMSQRAGLELAEGLPEQMVRDAAGSDNPLPLLGHTLRGLWTARSGPHVGFEHYQKLGGVSGALAQHAELLMDSLGEDGRERAMWLILALVQVGRGVADTRRPRTRKEVLAAAGDDSLAAEVLMRLSGVHARGSPARAAKDLQLVTIAGEPGMPPSAQHVDLVHETLLRQVPTITGWIDRERILLERHADLEVAAHAWEQAGGPTEGLPSGPLLAHYCGHGGDPRQRALFVRMASDRARRFVTTAQRLGRRRRFMKRALAVILAAAAATILVMALHARRERERAEGNLRQLILATDQVVSEADWELARVHHTMKIRRDLLQRLDDNLNALPASERAQRSARLARIAIKHRRGDLALVSEPLAQAARMYQAAHELIDHSRDGRLEDTEISWLLGLNHSKRGKVTMARGWWAETREHFAAALAVFEGLNLGSGDEDARRTLATSYSEQADLELALDRPEIAAPLYDQAIALLEQNDNDDYDRSLLAFTLGARGQAAQAAGDRANAAMVLQRALQLQQAVVRRNDGDAFYGWILARIHIELGALRMSEDRLTEAAEQYHAARELGQALHHGNPDNKDYALVLGHSLQGSEALERRQHNLARADKIHGERCALAAKLVRADSEDIRFQRLACR